MIRDDPTARCGRGGQARGLSAGVAIVAGCWLLAGCSDAPPATCPVTGQVVFADGTAVTSGRIELESESSGVNARGDIQPDGSFRLTTYDPGDGAVPGRHRAAVVQLFFAQGERAIHHDHAAGAGRTPAVHPKHARYETSGLTVDVSADGENRVRIVVEAAP